jgi:glutamyl-tRNA reductase
MTALMPSRRSDPAPAVVEPAGLAQAGGARTRLAPTSLFSASATVVGLVAHARRVPSLRREAFAAAIAALPPSEGLIVVHTCHRVEVYISPAAYGDRPLPELPEGARVLDDVEAARHLISVACGLDSAVLGEDQILHQLRETIADRHATRPLDPLLDRLFQAALHAGRLAHTWFSGSPRSLADVALDRIARRTGPLEGRTILVAGVGRMGRLRLAAARRGAHVIVTNRAAERAVALAHEVGGDVVPFGSTDLLGPIDGAIVALAGEWRLGADAAAHLVDGGAVVTDLSSPPAVEADLQARLGERYVSVDDLADSPEYEPQERLRRKIEGLVSETGRDYCHWLRSRDAVPAIQAMAASAEDHRRTELDWLLRRLPDLSPDERAVVEQMSHRIVGGILHAPLAALNSDPSGDLERAARELFGL